MKPIAIWKLGATFDFLARRHGDFEDWIRARLGVPAERVVVVDACQETVLPEPQDFAGIVLTGSHAMVTDHEPWSERTAAWIPGAVEAEVPLLGICYGHQLLAHAMGGKVDYLPRGREVGTVEVVLHEAAAADRLFCDLPRRMLVHASHAQSVVELPPGATCLASNAHDPHHAFVLGKAAWGVQFHPEFDQQVLRTYIEAREEDLQSEGLDPQALLASLRPTPQAGQLLARFGRMAIGEGGGTRE